MNTVSAYRGKNAHPVCSMYQPNSCAPGRRGACDRCISGILSLFVSVSSIYLFQNASIISSVVTLEINEFRNMALTIRITLHTVIKIILFIHHILLLCSLVCLIEELDR